MRPVKSNMANPSRHPAAAGKVEVAIERLALGGAGVARHGGRVLFVPGALPGDRVRAALTAVRARHLEGRLLEVLEPSPHRVAPPCPYAGRCGGCAWLALEAGRQRSAKADLVRDALERIGALAVAGEVAVAGGDEPGLAYRGRIEVALGPAGAGGARAVGFRAAASREVVDVERCAVASPPLNDALEGLRRAARAGRVPGELAEVEIAVGDDPARVVATARLAQPAGRRVAEGIADRLVAAWPGLAGLRVEEPPGSPDAAERGDPRLTVSVPGPGERRLPLEVPAGVFAQANPAVNARLVAAVAPASGARVLDLFCGCGNFTLPLAAHGAQALGFETDARAVDAARRSAARLRLEGARFRQVNAAEGLARVAAQGEGTRPCAVVLDPPRAGAGAAVVDAVAALQPAGVAYVSCEPATLARDLARFARRAYAVAAVTVFDMFPQTAHVETLAVLRGPRP